MSTPGDGSSRVLVSAQPDWLPCACAEVEEAFETPPCRVLGPDAALVENVEVTTAAAAVASGELLFVRHLVAVVDVVPTLDDAAALLEPMAVEAAAGTGRPVPLQVWSAGSTHAATEVRQFLIGRLDAARVSASRSGGPETLSVCATPAGFVVGMTPLGASVCDWPGGRVALKRTADRISRSEFKLEELLRLGAVEMPRRGLAVDLGASPGGWTRVLRAAGLEVWAVDPGDLDARVSRDKGVRHVRTTAGSFLRQHDEVRFDVVANDMRMPAMTAAQVLVKAASRVAPGGIVISTLKLAAPPTGAKDARQALRKLRTAYEVTFARQLHHNRQEITVVAIRA